MKKVTPELIQSRIKEVKYQRVEGTTTTICIIILDNNFVFVGQSACVDPTTFNEKLGEEYAYKDAFEKIWLPMGFAMAESK